MTKERQTHGIEVDRQARLVLQAAVTYTNGPGWVDVAVPVRPGQEREDLLAWAKKRMKEAHFGRRPRARYRLVARTTVDTLVEVVAGEEPA